MCPLANPGFYIVNWLWMGKCHWAMGHKEEAKPWLEKVISYDTHLEEELEVLTLHRETHAPFYMNVHCVTVLQAKKEAETLLDQL